MLVHVTQDHINRGLRGNASFCPVAQAIKGTTGFSCYVWTDEIYTMRTSFPMCRLKAVKAWIKKFDRGEPVEPFSFELIFGE